MRGQPRSRLAARVACAPARHKCFIAVSVCRSCARAPCVDYSTFILSKNGLRDTRTVVCLGLSSDHSHATLSLRTSARSGSNDGALAALAVARLSLTLSLSLPLPGHTHRRPFDLPRARAGRARAFGDERSAAGSCAMRCAPPFAPSHTRGSRR